MTSFSTIGIREDILKAVEPLGFTAPTPVQLQTIPLLLSGHNDLVGLAQTGTGKTAAFGLPIIQLIDPKRKIPQALVLCPTRELCMQVTKDLETYSRFTPGIKAVAVYGGANIVNQIRDFKRGAQIIVATPGRLLDLLRRGEANIASIQTLVLDEADEMLQMGFQDELNAILAETPATKRTVLFSATMPREVAAIAQKYMRDPIEITVGDRNTGTENVEHVYYVVQNHNRYAAMKRIADINPDMYAIVFCRTRQETKDIAEKFIKDGYNAEALHGELSQAQRDQVMDRFRAMNLRLLVATDVAARGIDVKDLTHVVNYNLPDESANYTHRSGRTGRAGRTGISVSFVTANERYKILEIEKRIKRKFERGIIPTAHDICERQLFNHIETIKKVAIAHDQIQRYMPAINESLAELSPEAPNFTANTTQGTIDFHSWIGDSWTILFSHPKDFTPVCTTELGYMAGLKPEFDKRNTKIIGLSVDPVENHSKWAHDIEETQGHAVNYPMIGDTELKVAKAYDMLPEGAGTTSDGRTAADNATVRSVFVIGPDKKVKAMLTYPMTTGRNFDEVLRLLDSCQLTAKHTVATPVNWRHGEDVIIPPAVSNEQAAAKYPNGWKTLKPYLRVVAQPGN